ncbi:MAG: protein-export chaperone SecB [Micavibrio sp.]|nr:protein-export chaperone SecB [Micavibrio sp.]
MAKDNKQDNAPATAPATAAAPAGETQAQPGVQVVAQYIKDFSFENPNAPESLVSGWPQPETNVQIFLRHQPVKDDVYEVSVNFRIEAKRQPDDKVCFIIDLSYGALVVLKHIPAENHQPVIMVEVPKLLFPFAREIVANVTSAGGYPPLYLTPISFEAIYINELKRLQDEKKQQAAG